ncbi:hypothetical protein D6833_02280 [Candidatus Parcubacteria bacterium]|nr:MAG: hypothetical protein D6833_02280 [Candidatus Parcubacteria bacterium]
MPPLAKSANANLETHTGDVHSHLFSINTNPDAPQFSEDLKVTKPYLTLPYACQWCHDGTKASAQDLDTLANMANGYHNPENAFQAP